ncbi:MAG TPA: class I SAM-dependent methyltransferase [Candidatus Babeliales bacterium]|nr:class I SAM-dependent methyltransferase [Candidatus Babeliales bacterium]
MKKITVLGMIIFVITFEVFSLTAKNLVYVYKNDSSFERIVTEAFDKLNIEYKIVDAVKEESALYILFDVLDWDEKNLPKYFIAYQSFNLSSNILTESYLSKLRRAIVVWDYSRENIDQYKSKLFNYFYFPSDYEFIDPICLVCKLPIEALKTYRDLLMYSNSNNTDISSHLPTLFYYGLVQNPKIIVEAGVRGGESTIPLRKAQSFCGSQLIGIDISPYAGNAYQGLANSAFVCMDDLLFPEYYKNKFGNQKIDLVFIDTSHLYEHTLAEIKAFVPLLSVNGLLAFHDSNVTPIEGHSWITISNVVCSTGPGNTRGVTEALQEYLGMQFDESCYLNFHATSVDGNAWHVIHYPFCNGFTILKKENK